MTENLALAIGLLASAIIFLALGRLDLKRENDALNQLPNADGSFHGEDSRS